MSHSCVEIYVHVIFATHDRSNLIPIEMESRLHGYMAGISKERKTPFLKINGMSDHIHILLKLHPTVALSTLIKELKSYSTGWMKKQGFADFGWQDGYGAFSCSVTHLKPLMNYIENQKDHHKVKTFADEIDILNARWGVSWMRDDDESP